MGRHIGQGRASAEATDQGALRRFDIDGLSMLQYPASELEAGLANVWLRRTVDSSLQTHPLTGPASGGQVSSDDSSLTIRGRWAGLAWACRFVLDDDVWFWHVDVTNEGGPCEVDIVCAHDIALTPYGAVRINEFYVSQYLDLTPVRTTNGPALAVRQNMPGERVPWVLLGSLRYASGWATDALQLIGEADARPVLDLGVDLPSARLQHEHTLAALADAPVRLGAGQSHHTGFYGRYLADHPAASGADDAAELGVVRLRAGAALGAAPVTLDDQPAQPSSLFATAPGLAARDLNLDEANALVGAGRHHLEQDGDGWASFVTDDGWAVTSQTKERAVLRPHGHILRTGHALTAETDVLTSTIGMAGVFASQITQGHVGRTTLVSGRRTYLGLQAAHGLRAFVDTGDGIWRLLDLPSAWAITPGAARWIYASGDDVLEVSATAPTDRHELAVTFTTRQGGFARILVAVQLAAGGDDGQAPAAVDLTRADGRAVGALGEGSYTLAWDGEATAGDDAALFSDGSSRGLPWLTLLGGPGLTVRITADIVPDAEAVAPVVQGEPDLWGGLGLDLSLPDEADVARLAATLPWFAHNAFVHYLSPRGLEQFSGGGWGTRDVCQGPVGLLTALGRTDAIRDVLLRVYAAQNDDGDWPQWFDFLPPLGAGQADSHGDVIFWPVLALAEYLRATNEGDILHCDVAGASLRERVARTLGTIEARVIGATALPAYGHGDWNDSLQPADPNLAARMASAWTAVLQAQALRTLADALPADDELGGRARDLAARTGDDLHRLLLADGVLAGYGVFGDDGELAELLVHPRDARTGLTYGVLPWIHAISADLLSPQQARHHLDLLKQHLLGPDGARLFDAAPHYRGGPMEVFKRAETATFWGREIGLMYTHAHLRYAEALARVGDAEALWLALRQVNPLGLADVVPQARPRQATCYYSSSDAVLADRAKAAERYADVMAGRVPLEGGWRIYSSGPGLFLRLVVENLLGVRQRGDAVELDPVLAPALDGLHARVPVAGRLLDLTFHGWGAGVARVLVAGSQVSTEPLANPYRAGGVRVSLEVLTGPIDVFLD